MSAINGVNSLSAVGVNGLSDDKMGDIQLEFAKLQMSLANTNKDQAMIKIKAIKENQAKSARLVELMNQLRDAMAGKVKDDETLNVPEDLAKACLEEFGVNVHSGSVTLATAKADLQSLQAKQDTLNADVQQEMVLIQDYMGKYSAYTSGATAQISKYSDTLTNIARGQ